MERLFIQMCLRSVLCAREETAMYFLFCSARCALHAGVSNFNPMPTPPLPIHLSSPVSDLERACGQPNNEPVKHLGTYGTFRYSASVTITCVYFGCSLLAASCGVRGEGVRPSPIAWQAHHVQGRVSSPEILANGSSENRFFPPLSFIVLNWNSL